MSTSIKGVPISYPRTGGGARARYFASRPQKRKIKEFAFRGLLFCGECGCAITSETQKGHNYYRCTKKRSKCSQGYIREEVLADQINKQIQKVSLSSVLG